MNVQRLESLPPPPGIIASLRAGFDSVSSHVGLILLPLALDAFLWLGPRLSADELLRPFLRLVFDRMRLGVDAAEIDQFVRGQAEILEWLQNFNLFSLLTKLQIFPIGISSLSAETLPVKTPFGMQAVLPVGSLPVMLGISGVLILVGLIGGGLYYRRVAGTTLGQEESGISSSRAIFQTFALTLMWIVGLMMVSMPILFVLFILLLINPALVNGAVFVMLILSFWLIVPLFFSPHGIFVRRQNALYSAISSLQMTRFTLPMSGMFVLSVFLLSRGLNYLWSVPPNDSWMLLVGIAGHAFISTALLAASFVYYRDMNAWMQTVLERLQQKQSLPTRQV